MSFAGTLEMWLPAFTSVFGSGLVLNYVLINYVATDGYGNVLPYHRHHAVRTPALQVPLNPLQANVENMVSSE